LSDIASRDGCLESYGNHYKETIMINEKDDIPRDDADAREGTINHETIPGKRPTTPGNKPPVAGGKAGDGPGTGRSTSDEDLN